MTIGTSQKSRGYLITLQSPWLCPSVCYWHVVAALGTCVGSWEVASVLIHKASGERDTWPRVWLVDRQQCTPLFAQKVSTNQIWSKNECDTITISSLAYGPAYRHCEHLESVTMSECWNGAQNSVPTLPSAHVASRRDRVRGTVSLACKMTLQTLSPSSIPQVDPVVFVE